RLARASSSWKTWSRKAPRPSTPPGPCASWAARSCSSWPSWTGCKAPASFSSRKGSNASSRSSPSAISASTCPPRPSEVFVAVRFLLRYNEPHLASRRITMIRMLTLVKCALITALAGLAYPGQVQAQDKKVEEKKVDPKPVDDKSAEPSKDLL